MSKDNWLPEDRWSIPPDLARNIAAYNGEIVRIVGQFDDHLRSRIGPNYIGTIASAMMSGDQVADLHLQIWRSSNAPSGYSVDLHSGLSTNHLSAYSKQWGDHWPTSFPNEWDNYPKVSGDHE